MCCLNILFLPEKIERLNLSDLKLNQLILFGWAGIRDHVLQIQPSACRVTYIIHNKTIFIINIFFTQLAIVLEVNVKVKGTVKVKAGPFGGLGRKTFRQERAGLSSY